MLALIRTLKNVHINTQMGSWKHQSKDDSHEDVMRFKQLFTQHQPAPPFQKTEEQKRKKDLIKGKTTVRKPM